MKPPWKLEYGLVVVSHTKWMWSLIHALISVTSCLLKRDLVGWLSWYFSHKPEGFKNSWVLGKAYSNDWTHAYRANQIELCHVLNQSGNIHKPGREKEHRARWWLITKLVVHFVNRIAVLCGQLFHIFCMGSLYAWTHYMIFTRIR